MRTRLVVTGLGLVFAVPLQAYITSLPSYEQLAKEAEAIVIAVPIERNELSGPAALPGVKRGNDPVPAVEIRTTFKVSAVLNGDALAVGDSFALRHFREKNPPTLRTGGPALIDFDPKEPHNYLMFLKKHPEGFFEAVNPVEPGWCIEALDHPVK